MATSAVLRYSMNKNTFYLDHAIAAQSSASSGFNSAEIWTAYTSSCQLEPQQHKFSHKYAECFYWPPQICCVFLLAPTVKLSLCPAAQI